MINTSFWACFEFGTSVTRGSPSNGYTLHYSSEPVFMHTIFPHKSLVELHLIEWRIAILFSEQVWNSVNNGCASRRRCRCGGCTWQSHPVSVRCPGIRKWVLRLWKRPFWFSKKVNITLSLNWSMPYQGGCSQFLISSKGFDSSICDWKNKFSLFGKYHLFRIESFRVDFRCVHRLQLLKVCDQYVTLPNSTRVQSVSEEQSR